MMGLGFVIPVIMSVLRGLKTQPEWGLGPAAVLVIFALPFAQRAILQVRMGTAGAALNPVLGLTAKTQIAHASFLTLGLLVDRALREFFL
jgi:1,4-dihydroxy-2-naphthoate octaprenyltransferase